MSHRFRELLTTLQRDVSGAKDEVVKRPHWVTNDNVKDKDRGIDMEDWSSSPPCTAEAEAEAAAEEVPTIN